MRGAAVMSMPWKLSLVASIVASGPSRPAMAMAVTDLPDPEAPTMPTVSPGLMVRLTPRTRSTRSPRRSGKLTRRSSTSTSASGSPAARARALPALYGFEGVLEADSPVSEPIALRIRPVRMIAMPGPSAAIGLT